MAVIATITAIVAGIGAGLAVGGSIAAFSWTAAAIAFGASMVMSIAGHLLAPKPQSGSLTSFGDGDFTRQFRQSTAERTYVYGECRVSGAVAFIGSTDDDKYLHIVTILAGHEIQEIGEIIINDQSIPPDHINGSGMVTTGVYADKIRIRKHLGTASQVADSLLVSEVSGWTTDHRLRGIAYMYCRLEYDRDVFTSGIPNFSAYIKGKKILDPRVSVTRYTANIALMVKDYLTDTKVGFNVPEAFIA